MGPNLEILKGRNYRQLGREGGGGGGGGGGRGRGLEGIGGRLKTRRDK